MQICKSKSADLFHLKLKLSSSLSQLLQYTVVIRGHTEGIPREKTSSEKYTVFSL